ncbi:MAG: hypothetical protein ACJAVZ_000110 [Afipia broomeae]|jgi:hypothetical protein
MKKSVRMKKTQSFDQGFTRKMKITRQHITALTDRSPINAYSELIGRDDLELIVAELTDALQPCGEPVAQAEAKRLAACYPTFRPTPEWLALIEDALKDAPCDLIRKACQSLAETAKFPPNKAQVKEAVLELTDKRRAVRLRAKRMLSEHDRRASAEAEETAHREAREEFRKKLAGRTPLQMIQDEQDDQSGSAE